MRSFELSFDFISFKKYNIFENYENIYSKI
jgi:hypothetical protein